MREEILAPLDLTYSLGLSEVTTLAEAQQINEIARILELDEADIQFSLTCVGNKLRKGSSENNSIGSPVSHFTHMVRVAYMVKHFFPNDLRSRRLAILHDIKEEARAGQEETYLASDLATDIDLLTEKPAQLEDVEYFSTVLPDGFDAVYFAKYKSYINDLHLHWSRLGALELCDRLDASTSVAYLLHPNYAQRLKYKALESLGRVWATIAEDESSVSDQIKENYRFWFSQLGVSEQEVEAVAKYFL